MKSTLLTYALVLGLALLGGCQRAPSFDVLGSFFPVWMFCILAGVLLTSLVRLVLTRARIAQELGPTVVVYPSFAALFSFSIWLLFFRT